MKQKKAKQGGPAAKGKRRRPVELRWDPDSERRLRERLESPEGKRILHELIRILAEAAVDRMLQESADQDTPKTNE